MKPLTPARFAAAEWLESKINAWDAAVSADPPDLMADLPPLPGDVPYAAFLGALREMVAGVVVAPKPEAALGLLPHVPGKWWARIRGASVHHLWTGDDMPRDFGARASRGCAPGWHHSLDDLAVDVVKSSRPCPACVAIATKGAP
jgi:hypothetical protein